MRTAGLRKHWHQKNIQLKASGWLTLFLAGLGQVLIGLEVFAGVAWRWKCWWLAYFVMIETEEEFFL